MFCFWRNLQDIVIPRDQGWKRIHLTSVIHYSLSLSSKKKFVIPFKFLLVIHSSWLVIHYSGFSKPQNSLFIFCLILLFIIHYLASTPYTFRTKSITSCPHKRWRFKLSCLMHSKWGNFSGSGACFSKVPKLFGRISGDTILFVSSKQRRLEERNFEVIFVFIPFTTYETTSNKQNKQVVLLRMAFRARKVLGTFEKRAPSQCIVIINSIGDLFNSGAKFQS